MNDPLRKFQFVNLIQDATWHGTSTGIACSLRERYMNFRRLYTNTETPKKRKLLIRYMYGEIVYCLFDIEDKFSCIKKIFGEVISRNEGQLLLQESNNIRCKHDRQHFLEVKSKSVLTKIEFYIKNDVKPPTLPKEIKDFLNNRSLENVDAQSKQFCAFAKCEHANISGEYISILIGLAESIMYYKGDQVERLEHSFNSIRLAFQQYDRMLDDKIKFLKTADKILREVNNSLIQGVKKGIARCVEREACKIVSQYIPSNLSDKNTEESKIENLKLCQASLARLKLEAAKSLQALTDLKESDKIEDKTFSM